MDNKEEGYEEIGSVPQQVPEGDPGDYCMAAAVSAPQKCANSEAFWYGGVLERPDNS